MFVLFFLFFPIECRSQDETPFEERSVTIYRIEWWRNRRFGHHNTGIERQIRQRLECGPHTRSTQHRSCHHFDDWKSFGLDFIVLAYQKSWSTHQRLQGELATCTWMPSAKQHFELLFPLYIRTQGKYNNRILKIWKRLTDLFVWFFSKMKNKERGNGNKYQSLIEFI